ncbi:uncharacterized protein LOC124649734 isoform X2 [Lolium rigidum]|uniref:uncharacterized protein LOC124649734 isoform X2 n=1 Tax=Lolium rigidum TaxID=89674 RepID=UPI001F5DFF40|nr:uncharacterized protein LOC124649734 isoform X2 [Lolium rigidum]
MAPPATPGTFDFGLAVGETADTQEGAVVKSLESGKKQPVDSVRDGGETSTKRLADSVGGETETTKKRRFSVGVESETAKKRSCSSRLGADTFGLFKGKPTGDGEGIFSSGMELAAGTSTGHLKSFKKKHKGTEGLMEIGSPNLVKHITKSKDAHSCSYKVGLHKRKHEQELLMVFVNIDGQMQQER